MNRAVTASIVALVAGGAVGFAPTPASASELGGLAFVPARGSAESLVTITTERGCTEGAATVLALMSGPGMPEGGQVIFGPSSLELSTTSPMVLAVSNAFVVFAQDNATVLDGKYRVTVQCLDAQAASVLDSFSSTMTWTMPAGSKDKASARYVAVSNARGLTQPAVGVPSVGSTTVPKASQAPAEAGGAPKAGAGGATSAPRPQQDKELSDGSNPAARPEDVAADASATDASAADGDGGMGRPALLLVAALACLAGLGLAARTAFRGRSRPDQTAGPSTDELKEHLPS